MHMPRSLEAGAEITTRPRQEIAPHKTQRPPRPTRRLLPRFLITLSQTLSLPKHSSPARQSSCSPRSLPAQTIAHHHCRSTLYAQTFFLPEPSVASHRNTPRRIPISLATMQFFVHITALLFALFACAFAQQTTPYDATVYITSTVYRVNTVYASSSPSASVANVTSTVRTPVPTTTNATKPTAATAKPSASQFSAGASSLNANAAMVAFAAGIGYLVL